MINKTSYCRLPCT